MRKQLLKSTTFFIIFFISIHSKASPVDTVKAKQARFTNITEASLGMQLQTAGNGGSYGIQTINGVYFYPYVSLGIGVGINVYENSTVIPIFGEIRANFSKSTITPFFSGAFGYSIGSDKTSGIYIDPALGLKFFITNKTALNISIGYRKQELYSDSYFYSQMINNLSFKMGASF